MELSRIIIGLVTTEKAERLKLGRSYTLHVAPKATKIDVSSALAKFYDVEVTSVRSMRTPSKVRKVARGQVITKRKPTKKVIVTLSKKSKPLDIANFKI